MAKKELTEQEMTEQAWELRKKAAGLSVEEERIDFELEHDYITPEEAEEQYGTVGSKKEKLRLQIEKLALEAKKKGYQKVIIALQAITERKKK